MCVCQILLGILFYISTFPGFFSVWAHRVSLVACRKRDGFISQDGRPSCFNTPPPFNGLSASLSSHHSQNFVEKSCWYQTNSSTLEYNFGCFDWLINVIFLKLQNNQPNELAPPTPAPSWLNWRKNFTLIATCAGHVGSRWPLCSTWLSAKSKSGSRIAAWNSKKNKREEKEAAAVVVVGINHPVHPLARP